MVAAAAPQKLSGRSLVGKVALALAKRSRARNGRPSAAAVFVVEHVGTLAALGFADAACWHWGHAAGLFGTAVCIVVAEFKVRG